MIGKIEGKSGRENINYECEKGINLNYIASEIANKIKDEFPKVTR